MVNVTPTSLQLRQRLAAVGIVACLIVMVFGFCQAAGLGGLIAPTVPAIFIGWLVLASLVWLLAVIITDLEARQLIFALPPLRLLAGSAGLLSSLLSVSPPPPRPAS